MKKKPTTKSKQPLKPSQKKKPDTSLRSRLLTASDVERLRRKAARTAQKVFDRA